MAEIEINDRVLCKFVGQEYAGKVLEHPALVCNVLCRFVEFDEGIQGRQVSEDDPSPSHRRWHVPVGDIRHEPGNRERTLAAINDAKLHFETLVVPTANAANIVAEHEARGWVLVARHNTAAGVCALMLATTDKTVPDARTW